MRRKSYKVVHVAILFQVDMKRRYLHSKELTFSASL